MTPEVQRVVELVNAADDNPAPTEGDCESPLVWWGGSAVSYDHADEMLWVARAPSHGVRRYCGCGCGCIYNHCDDCGRRVVTPEDFRNPDTTSSYWLCRDCCDKWETRRQYNRHGGRVRD